MEKAPEIKRTAEVLRVELPPIDPLDPAQLEQFMLERSGLPKVRQTLPTERSGGHFYHANTVMQFRFRSLMGASGYRYRVHAWRISL